MRTPDAYTARMTAPSSPSRPGEGDSAPEAFLDAVRAELPDLRLLEDAIDREAYRNDETAYLQTDLPLAVALPT